MRQLYDTYLGTDWEDRMALPETWAAIAEVDDGELWEAHQVLKTRLVSYVDRQIHSQESFRGASSNGPDPITSRLDPGIMTIGLGRRFATYKRHDLILTDEERLERLVTDPQRPVQIVFSGKAHPQDNMGKELIQRIFRMTRDERFLGRIVLIEDYDINVARHLVQGADLWLNCPRRPREASGTSGMKAVFNGVLNISIIDGWWAEAYDGFNGFAIGHGGQHADDREQDQRDAESLYTLLENYVIPLYYERDDRGVPTGWAARMKHAIQSLGWRFNADRMVMEYAKRCYLPTDRLDL
jgi:starch phosphorylase